MLFKITRSALLTGWVLGSCLMITACAVADHPQSADSRANDATITHHVKSRFLDSRRVDGRSIHVNTVDGIVLLTGTASSHVEKSRATELALGVNGVRLVQNEIAVAQ